MARAYKFTISREYNAPDWNKEYINVDITDYAKTSDKISVNIPVLYQKEPLIILPQNNIIYPQQSALPFEYYTQFNQKYTNANYGIGWALQFGLVYPHSVTTDDSGNKKFHIGLDIPPDARVNIASNWDTLIRTEIAMWFNNFGGDGDLIKSNVYESDNHNMYSRFELYRQGGYSLSLNSWNIRKGSRYDKLPRVEDSIWNPNGIDLNTIGYGFYPYQNTDALGVVISEFDYWCGQTNQFFGTGLSYSDSDTDAKGKSGIDIDKTKINVSFVIDNFPFQNYKGNKANIAAPYYGHPTDYISQNIDTSSYCVEGCALCLRVTPIICSLPK